MNSRDRVLSSLRFGSFDRVPKDLGGMASTGISAFAYPNLVNALGLEPRLPKIFDTVHMLALPDMDVLDALGCDVVTIQYGVTNAFEEPEKWKFYDFNGRLPALVKDPSYFSVLADGTIHQSKNDSKMLVSSTVFSRSHGGHKLNLDDHVKPDMKDAEQRMKAIEFTDSQIKDIVELCKKVRNSTDKAVFLAHPHNE